MRVASTRDDREGSSCLFSLLGGRGEGSGLFWLVEDDWWGMGRVEMGRGRKMVGTRNMVAQSG